MKKSKEDHRSGLYQSTLTESKQESPCGSFTSLGFTFSPYAEPYRPSRSVNASPILSRRDQLFQSLSTTSAPSTPGLSHSPRRSTLSTSTTCEGGPNTNGIINTSLYKTELCRSFVETGTCRYGNKCQFAHGEKELRPVQRHPRYKTEICQTFHQTGTCKYGSRCRFIHVLPGEPSPVSDCVDIPQTQNFSDISSTDEDSNRLPVFEQLSHN
ncbi:tristetraproline, putative [Entamoeba dispar SAW760]|uniref:Tristetraproline, putative n=1 Tax=Entamoeba dispar (strain ATCC PRA-260 / SAW760) TaxID=370354 RepID=B0E8M4_ENTDS|nr:tristetraproline, putative [Entamoeba dispar SAW760]EDR29114.1 tristetraproline, putative [Entamoeba dispar SAW760]|eukprot:EDR29114.1 tristetraproline, putative [Entamoeba dispar SAW760]